MENKLLPDTNVKFDGVLEGVPCYTRERMTIVKFQLLWTIPHCKLLFMNCGGYSVRYSSVRTIQILVGTGIGCSKSARLHTGDPLSEVNRGGYLIRYFDYGLKDDLSRYEVLVFPTQFATSLIIGYKVFNKPVEPL